MVKIKTHKEADIPLRVKWLNNPKVNKYTGEILGEKTSLKKQAEWFLKYKKDKNKRFFTIFYDKCPIGFMGLSNINRINNNADLFIAIGEDSYRGRGLGRASLEFLIDYAFKELKLHKINLGVVADNKPAVKLYKKLGFKVEGRMVEEVRHEGKYKDVLVMALFGG